jgi:hypothetical protein
LPPCRSYPGASSRRPAAASAVVAGVGGKAYDLGEASMTSTRSESLLSRLLKLLVVSRRDDVSPRLYSDVAAARHKLGDLEDTGRPELDTGKNPYGPIQDLYLVAILIGGFAVAFLIWLLVNEFVPLPP